LYRVTDQEEGDTRKTDPLKASIKVNIKRDHLDGKIKEEDVDVDIDILSYAPRVFRFIRAIDKIDEFDIMKSVKPELNRLQIFKVKEKQDH
jgi:1-phosphatidylinositol-4-phosphate 5-kinase